jgi:outer membrane lipoprotein-sorting protein
MHNILFKNLFYKPFFLLCLIGLICFSVRTSYGDELSAKDIVIKANDLLRGKSSSATAVMKVIKPDWSREMTTKIWMLEPDYAMILITDPAKDKGNVTLKREKEMWNWIPTIQRIIKIPPSMMMQPWMGSDFNNDDLVRESSIIEDYTQSLKGEENIDGYDCYKVLLMPKPEAGVVWGKVIMWISKKGYLELRTEYYDEDENLVKYMTGSKVKEMGGRTIPSYWEMIPVDKPGEKTVLEYQSMEFDIDIKPSFFSEQEMKRIR